MCMKFLKPTISKLWTQFGSNLSKTQKISLVLKVLSLLLLLAAFILIALSFAACKATKTTTTHVERRQAITTDSVAAIAVQWLSLQIVDTIWRVTPTDTTLFVRHAAIQQTKADTSRSLSLTLEAETATATTQTTSETTTYGTKKKKGGSWALPLVVSVCVVILTLFLLFRRFIFKK